MFFNTTHKKHRNLQGFWWVGGDPEVTMRWPPWGRRLGRLVTITFGYQPKASGKGTAAALGPAPGFKGYRPCRRPLSRATSTGGGGSSVRGPAQAPATLNKRWVTLHKRRGCNAEQACVQRWTSVLERCTSVFAALSKRLRWMKLAK